MWGTSLVVSPAPLKRDQGKLIHIHSRVYLVEYANYTRADDFISLLRLATMLLLLRFLLAVVGASAS